MPETKDVEFPLTAETAKALVFDHWEFLGKLSGRRYPNNDALAHEAVDYVLDKFQANDWKRVRAWEGLGVFATFFATLASRLFTDFSRAKFGHHRKPKWLAEKHDPLWDKAYRLLVVERYNRLEAIEMLLVSESSREQWIVEEVVTTTLQRCTTQPQSREQNVPIENANEQSAAGSTPDNELMIQDKEMVEALQQYLCSDAEGGGTISSRVSELLGRLNRHLKLSDEDRLILRLRYSDGIKMKDIVKMLQLEGDPYKRMNKLIRHMQKACKQAGFESQ